MYLQGANWYASRLMMNFHAELLMER